MICQNSQKNNYKKLPQEEKLLLISLEQQAAKAELELRTRSNISFYDWINKVSPQYNWDFPHLKLFREYLDRIIAGEQVKVMFFTEPQVGKSLHNSIHFPAYMLQRFPEKRIILGAHTFGFAVDFSTAVNRLIRENKPAIFDDIKLKQTANYWETTGGGFFKSVGVNSAVTGKSADIILIDDPVKSFKTAYSQVFRDEAWNWYCFDLKTRQQKHTSYVFTQTMWHHDDLANRILNSADGKNWDVIILPGLAKEDDILGREVDEPLCPELHPFEELDGIRRDSPSLFAALYQQSPEISGGNIFKRDNFKYCSELPNFDYIIQSIDGAWETKKQNDFSVCSTFGVVGNNIYLVALWRDKVEYPDFKRMIVAQNNEFKPMHILVENAASGKAAIQELGRQTFLPIKGINPTASKEVRAHSCTPLIESGCFYIYEKIDNMLNFLDEMIAFPAGKHDDMVDTVTMALNYIANFNNKINIRVI